MSTSSTQSRFVKKRGDSLQSNGKLSREGSYTHTQVISHNDAYLYALRVAYLAYLLHPRAKRLQHVPAAQAPVQRTSTSINDLMKDFSLVRDSKSTRFPHGFMAEFEKRLTGVVTGKERRPEYGDSAVKRSFAAFFNAFSEPGFKKRMEKDRRMEDLVLIFFSNATKELSKGKAPGDDGWKLLVDRHLALFVRLTTLVLRDHDWVRDRPELSSRLVTLESKLLSNDQDLSSAPNRNGSSGGTTVEVVVPLSYEVKDMPLVQTVGRIFGLRNAAMQSDINKYKSIWTESAALQDLKSYQAHLNVDSTKTLRPDDFDLDEAFEQWKKGEVHDISQMMLAIVQPKPELAKSNTSTLPQFNSQLSNGHAPTSQYPNTLRRTDSKEASSYVIDQPVDMSRYDSGNSALDFHSPTDAEIFTFIPSDTRGFYKFIVAQALANDLSDNSKPASQVGDGSSTAKLLSKQSTELLTEICLRWRIPYVSRMIIFLEVICEKFVDQEISLDTLDAAFSFVKEPLAERGQSSTLASSMLHDRSKWPLADIALNQHLLSTLHMALLRDLFETLQHCYEKQPPSVGPIVLILEEHIYNDPGFSEAPEKMVEYRRSMHEGLTRRAYEIYREYLQKDVPNDQHSWEFSHVIDLGKAVIALLRRVQKRYRKNPDIMG